MNITKSIVSGLRGFAVFFSIILIIKFISYSLNFTFSLKIEIVEIYQSLIGFVLFFMNDSIKRFIKNY